MFEAISPGRGDAPNYMASEHTPYKYPRVSISRCNPLWNREAAPSTFILVSCCQPLGKIFSTTVGSQQTGLRMMEKAEQKWPTSYSPVDTFVFLLPDIIVCAWNRIDEAVEIGVAEVRDGIASWMHVRFARRLYNAMLRTFYGIVRPPGHISITPQTHS